MTEKDYEMIQELLQQKADYNARLNLLPYDGTPEVKSSGDIKYLYIRKREGGRLKSTYVDKYSDELYQLLLRTAREARELRKNIRRINKELIHLGHHLEDLDDHVLLNIEFARVNMKANIYDQAVLEGAATTFPQTEDIIDNGKVVGMTATDVQKILNLKHAWEFILDQDVIKCPSNYYVLCHIAKLVNEGFYLNGGRIRGVPVTIGGTNYIPPLPIGNVIIEKIQSILDSNVGVIDKAIELCLYTMKTQIFNDGNKRAAVISANHYLIANGGGLIVIPEKEVALFKRLLVNYYEDKDQGEIVQFMKEKCWKRMNG